MWAHYIAVKEILLLIMAIAILRTAERSERWLLGIAYLDVVLVVCLVWSVDSASWLVAGGSRWQAALFDALRQGGAAPGR